MYLIIAGNSSSKADTFLLAATVLSVPEYLDNQVPSLSAQPAGLPARRGRRPARPVQALGECRCNVTSPVVTAVQITVSVAVCVVRELHLLTVGREFEFCGG